MQKIKIVTDSTCDLPQDIMNELDIIVVPLTVRFGKESYRDGVDISSEQFFLKLEESKEFPATSQVSVGQFTEIFEKLSHEHDDILGLFLSSKISGTYQSAVIAKNVLGIDQIYIMETKMATLAHGFIVREAAKMAKDGYDIKQIMDKVKYLSENLHSIIVLDTLTYVEKGGRIKSGVALAGNLLNIKPVVTFKNGEVVVLGKIRGRKKIIKWIINHIMELGIDLTDKTVGMNYVGYEEIAEELKNVLHNQFKVKELFVGRVGSVIGSYSGPTAIALYFDREG